MTSIDMESALRALADEEGRIAPLNVIEAARDPSSPLHTSFEWDDSVAGERYRLDQARSLIRRVVIEVVVRDVAISVPAYIRDPEKAAHVTGYRHIQSVRSDDDMARSAIVEEMARVASAVRRAKAVATVLGVQDDVQAIKDMALSVARRVQEVREA